VSGKVLFTPADLVHGEDEEDEQKEEEERTRRCYIYIDIYIHTHTQKEEEEQQTQRKFERDQTRAAYLGAERSGAAPSFLKMK